MKRTLLRLSILFSVMLVAGWASAQTYTVNLSWTNTSTAPACSATVTKSCVKSQTMTDVTVAASPVVLSSTIAPTATSFVTPAITYSAQITRLYKLVTNYVDGNGTAQVTGPASCATGTAGQCQAIIFIVLPPTNLTATPVQVSQVIEADPATGSM